VPGKGDGSGGGGVAVDSVTSARVVMQLCRRHPRLSLILAAAAADRVRPLLLRHLDHGKHGFHLPGLQYLRTASAEKQRCHCTLVPQLCQMRPIFTARRCASAAYAVAMCLSVCPIVRPCVAIRSFTKTAKRRGFRKQCPMIDQGL